MFQTPELVWLIFFESMLLSVKVFTVTSATNIYHDFLRYRKKTIILF